MRCAVVQSAPVFGEVPDNLDALVRAIEGVDDVDLVVAPELATTGYDLAGLVERGTELAEPIDGPSVARMRALSSARGSTLVVGILEVDADGDLYDTTVACRPDGSTRAYRKTHLYPAEQDLFAPGSELVTFDAGDVRVGPMICFEHAFPEIATTLTLAGAQVLAIPSAVPDGHEHLLELRSRARAQDNQVFVLAANLASDGFFGQSLVVDPRGDVLAAAGSAEDVLVVDLDLDAIAAERRTEPALRLRRPELYRRAPAHTRGTTRTSRSKP